jgi:hypothetical protein
MDNYYNETYFAFQKEQGIFASKIIKIFFQPYIKASDAVLDFGCGGGYLLNNLESRLKLGIEINSSARKSALEIGIDTVESISQVSDGWADVLISSHALEHVLRPYDILIELKNKIKIGGLVVFLVPHETKYAYNPQDINKHLYTWSEMNLGNLFSAAGFEVIESKELIHRFPPNHRKLYKALGLIIFHFLCRLYGRWARYRHMTQVRVIAKRIK